MDEDPFDDFDRELELALYREYRDVVSQFQYVIETERRFYLANEVNVVRRDTEHDFYFEISMQDVWVWDKNRPTRMIPRAEVYTSSDVTIEELRGEGDEPVLTAEALAKRIGEGRSEIEDP